MSVIRPVGSMIVATGVRGVWLARQVPYFHPMGKKGEMYIVLIYNQPTLAIAMAAQQFDLLIMMMESPLGRMDYTLGRDVNSCIRSNNMTNILMHSTNSGQGEQ